MREMSKQVLQQRFSSGRTRIEVSGGVTLRNIARFARLRPDRISVGALTHSAPAVDLSLLVEGDA